MDWEAQLIFIYVTLCDFFVQQSVNQKLKLIRSSPNSKPKFTDEEAMTIYIFGILKGYTSINDIHKHSHDHLKSFFPKLPKYKAFNYRLNFIMDEFMHFSDDFIDIFRSKNHHPENLVLLDSMPIMLAKGSRASKGKVALGTANLGYCASKNIFYHGIKFHLFADYVDNSLPNPHILNISGAKEHDLTAVRHLLKEFHDCQLIADKAYIDKILKLELKKECNTDIHTPTKFTKHKTELTENESLYSKIINSLRQPIESFFSWIIRKTDIQDGSKIRSEKGLVVHTFGRFAAAMILLVLQG